MDKSDSRQIAHEIDEVIGEAVNTRRLEGVQTGSTPVTWDELENLLYDLSTRIEHIGV